MVRKYTTTKLKVVHPDFKGLSAERECLQERAYFYFRGETYSLPQEEIAAIVEVLTEILIDWP